MAIFCIFLMSYVSHLYIEHNVSLVHTYTMSAYIYVLLKISDNSLRNMWLDRCLQSHAWFQLWVQELCMVSWMYTYDFTYPHHKKKPQGVRLQDLGGHCWLSCKNITHCRNLLWSNANIWCKVWQAAPFWRNQRLSVSVSPKFSHNWVDVCLSNVLH